MTSARGFRTGDLLTLVDTLFTEELNLPAHFTEAETAAVHLAME
jgi:hypothetical protein